MRVRLDPRDLLPPRSGKQTELTLPVTVRLSQKLLKELDAIASDCGYERAEVMRRFLQYAVGAYTAAKTSKKTRK